MKYVLVALGSIMHTLDVTKRWLVREDGIPTILKERPAKAGREE